MNLPNYFFLLVFIGMGSVVSFGQNCEPMTRRATIPNFPMAALAMSESGEVKIAVTVDSGGVVVSATALAGGAQLRKASVEVVKSWLFSGLRRREARKCGNRTAIIVFEYVLLPKDAVRNVESLSYFSFPNKVVIRYIRPEISVDRNKDPASIAEP